MTKEARIYKGEKTTSSISGVKLDSYMKTNPTGLWTTLIACTKINSKQIKDSNVSWKP